MRAERHKPKLRVFYRAMSGSRIPPSLALVLAGIMLAAVNGSNAARQAQTAGRVDNVILITLDGARTQEIFGGLDLAVLRSTLRPDAKVEETRSYQRFWAATPEARRARLMPFFWETLMARYGSIAGDRAHGSSVRVTNRHWFSYPGYAEILTGQAHDDVIASNDMRRNPYPTVLEFFKRKLKLDAAQVAAFASWDTFDWIVEHEPGAITSNAGFEAYDNGDGAVETLNRLQLETLTPWDGARFDAYTFRLAMAHLITKRPRVLYVAFDETDDWAHDGRYDRVLDALNHVDGYLSELWSALQAQTAYRDRTAILITVDHGRGDTPADWRDHGAKTPGSENIWIAFIGPEWPRRSEWEKGEPLYQNQVAATLAQALGLDYAEQNPTAGRPIAQLFAR
jgi:Type I phosphodiesterase / nucleotide pyrophosphatase